MKIFSNERSLICEAIMWVGDGARLIPHDEQHAFRYEVRDERGNVVGFINTDRARQHPDVKWERSLLQNGKIKELVGKYATVQEAARSFLVFQESR
jgi:hypothetical protein